MSPGEHQRIQDEGGWALVTAVILMAAMLALGLAVLSVVDGQQNQSAVERQKDTAFNFAEAALNATMFSLGNQWPGPAAGSVGSGVTAYPTCTQASVDPRCPDAGTLTSTFNSPDTTVSGATWTINVYDNGVDAQTGQSSAAFYSDTLTPRQPSYDANGDGKLWIRAQANVSGHNRVLVSEVGLQQQPESLPHAPVIAGTLQTSNQGNKVIIDTQGSALQPAPVELRCDPLTDLSCLVVRTGQISPDTVTSQYTGGNSLSTSALARLKATAIANGTYFTTCPANLPSGSVVFLDGISCTFNNNAVVNSAASPGILIVNNGTISFTGTLVFYGVIYATGSPPLSGTVVSVAGNTQIYGGVLVDGSGGVYAGSSKLNITYDANAFNAVKSDGAASQIQGTFRQLAIG